ncbi:ABC transporter substrate-binding protein [Hungatella hominis]|uniref:Extracellular solute-binding protein n=1 Tax=Hungatella hominis TaxID=2763050 RepID=A0ABR7H1Z4_9FIRM|nr:extracellular solute-binding protein [Hungatella hominis]MBC5707160.1 extracellular solute-binding protein [Hungatella hominis]
MKKRGLAMGIAVVLGCMSLTGCGGSSNETKNGETAETTMSGSEAKEEGEIELTMMGGAHLVSVAEIVLRDYLTEHPNVKINFEKYSYAEYPTKMKLQLSNDESTPDIMIVHDLYAPQFAKAGYLVDMSDMFTEGEVLPVMDPVTMEGKVYGIPNQVTNQYVFMYRQDIYDELGLTAPKTFDDYFNQAVMLKENGYYAGAFDPADSGCNEVFQNFIYMLGGQVLDSEGNVSLDKGKEALELMKKCYDAGIWHTSQQGNSEAYWTAFNAGKIAAFPSVAAHAAYYVTNVDPNGQGGYGHLAIAEPMKFAENGRETYINNTEYYTINKNTEHLETAKDVVRYLALTKEAAEKFSNVNEDGVMAQYATGCMEGIRAIAASRDNGWEAFGGEPVVSELAEILLNTDPDIPFVDERSNEMNNVLSEIIGEMFLNGAYTPETAVEVMKQKLNDI